MSHFNSRVAGIPCTIRIDHFSQVKGSFSYHAASDMDYYGYSELAYTICDQRGRPAPWLEKKATDADHRRILNDMDAAHS